MAEIENYGLKGLPASENIDGAFIWLSQVIFD